MTMMVQVYTFLVLFFWGASQMAQASSSAASSKSLAYQGRILKANGTAFEIPSASFLFQILDPSGQCLIYQEQVDGINMMNSKGLFDVPIGAGSKHYVSGGGSSVVDIFNNSTNYACGTCNSVGNSYTCSATSSQFNPISGAGRLLRVSFFDGSGWRTITPDNEIRSVPYAGYSISAEKLGDYTSSDFILKSEVNGNSSCTGGQFLTWNASTKMFGCATPSIAPAPPGGAAGGDLAGTYPNPTVSSLSGKPLAVSSATSGQFLKYDAGNWVNSLIQQNDISGLSTALNNLIPYSKIPNCSSADSVITFVSATDSFSCSAISLAGSQVNGNITGKAAGFTGGLSGDVSGSQESTVVVGLQGRSLASTAPTSDQVLKWDALNSQWTPATLSLDWPSTPLPVANGGTGASSFSNLSAIASDNTGKLTSVPGSLTGSVFQWSSSGPSWSAASFPSSTTANQILYSSADNLVGGLATANDSVLITNSSGVPGFLSKNSDLFSQYLLLAGRSGGQTLFGGTAANENLAIESTANSSKGFISLNSSGGNVGVNTSSPNMPLTVGPSLLSTATASAATATSTLLVSDAPTFTSGRSATAIFLSQPNPSANGTSNNSGLIVDMNVPASTSTNIGVTRGALISNLNSSSGTTTAQYGLQLSANNAGTVTNQYGLYSANNNTSNINGNQVGGAIALTNTGTITGNQIGLQASLSHTSATNLNGQWASNFSASHNGVGTVAEQMASRNVSGNSSTGTITELYGSFNSANNSSSGHVDYSQGINSRTYNGGTGSITSAYGTFAQIWNASTGTIDTAHALYGDIYNPNGGTVTTGYGLYLGSISATNRWSIYASDATAPSFFSGNVGIGVLNPSYPLHVSGDIYASGYFRSPNGTIQTSDLRFKKNIRPVTNSVEKISSLTGVTYDWRVEDFANRSFNDKHQMGVIAQEVEKQFPEAVVTDEEGYKAVNYASLVAPLINAVKELYAKQTRQLASVKEQEIALKNLEIENKKLQKENAEIKDRLEKLEKFISKKNQEPKN